MALIGRSPVASPSLDYLVSTGQQRRRHRNPKRLCGLQVEDQIELGWPVERDLPRLFTLEDPGDGAGRLAGKVRKVQRISHEPTDLHVLAERVHRRETGFRGQLDDKPPMGNVLWSRRNHKSIHALLCHAGKSPPVLLLLDDASKQGIHKANAEPPRGLIRPLWGGPP
jgi:hypothetical protein